MDYLRTKCALAAALLLMPIAMVAQQNAASLSATRNAVIMAGMQSGERLGQKIFYYTPEDIKCDPPVSQKAESGIAEKNIHSARTTMTSDQSSESSSVDSQPARDLGQDDLKLSIAAQTSVPEDGAVSCSVIAAPE